jgi:S1-C subfamily serine protease
VQLEVMRYGQKKSVSVRLTELTEAARVSPASLTPTAAKPATGLANAELGVTLAAIPADIVTRAELPENRRGVMVTDVVPLGPSFQKLGPNDVIFQVLYPAPRREIKSAADLQAVLSKLKTGDYISLNVHSLAQGGSDRVVNIRIGD